MTEKLEIYKCNICGNLIQVLINGHGELVCCGEAMKLQIPQQDNNEIGEKHSPSIEFKENKKFVQVLNHPMIDEHYIQFIEVYKKDKSKLYLEYFKPQETPQVDISFFGDDVSSIEFCNVHGLWGEKNND